MWELRMEQEGEVIQTGGGERSFPCHQTRLLPMRLSHVNAVSVSSGKMLAFP